MALWDTTTDWDAYQERDDVAIESGSVRLVPPPDSAIHRWRFDEGSGTTVADDIGTADGSVNGATWTSGTWVGDTALDGDGTDDYVSTTALGTFGSSMDTNFAILLTLQTSDSSARMLGRSNTGDNQLMMVAIGENGGNGDLEFFLRDPNGNAEAAYTANPYDDGAKHRVVVNKTSNSASGFEIWVDGQSESMNVDRSQGFSSPTDFDGPVNFFELAESGGNINGVMDDIIICNDSLTSTEIADDYARQPWS